MKLYPFLLLIVFTFISCDGFEELNIVGNPDVKIRGINKGEIELDLIVKIENPNARSFKVKKASFEVYVNGAKVAHSTMSNAIVIQANTTDRYFFPMKVKLEGKEFSISMLLNTFINQNIELKVDGTIKAGSFFINQKFPVQWEENIRL
jgi:LEA14-like dessication related protein